MGSSANLSVARLWHLPPVVWLTRNSPCSAAPCSHHVCIIPVAAAPLPPPKLLLMWPSFRSLPPSDSTTEPVASSLPLNQSPVHTPRKQARWTPTLTLSPAFCQCMFVTVASPPPATRFPPPPSARTRSASALTSPQSPVAKNPVCNPSVIFYIKDTRNHVFPPRGSTPVLPHNKMSPRESDLLPPASSVSPDITKSASPSKYYVWLPASCCLTNTATFPFNWRFSTLILSPHLLSHQAEIHLPASARYCHFHLT